MSLEMFDNIYVLGLGLIILASFGVVFVSSIIGVFRINKSSFSKCPNCSEKLENGIIICKSCGVNINSVQGIAHLPDRNFARNIKDYIDNLEPKNIRFIGVIIVFLIMVGYAVISIFT